MTFLGGQNKIFKFEFLKLYTAVSKNKFYLVYNWKVKEI